MSRYPGPIITFIYNTTYIIKIRQNDSRPTARPHHIQLNATKLCYGVPFLFYFIQFILYFIYRKLQSSKRHRGVNGINSDELYKNRQRIPVKNVKKSLLICFSGKSVCLYTKFNHGMGYFIFQRSIQTKMSVFISLSLRHYIQLNLCGGCKDFRLSITTILQSVMYTPRTQDQIYNIYIYTYAKYHFSTKSLPSLASSSHNNEILCHQAFSEIDRFSSHQSTELFIFHCLINQRVFV